MQPVLGSVYSPDGLWCIVQKLLVVLGYHTHAVVMAAAVDGDKETYAGTVAELRARGLSEYAVTRISKGEAVIHAQYVPRRHFETDHSSLDRYIQPRRPNEAEGQQEEETPKLGEKRAASREVVFCVL